MHQPHTPSRLPGPNADRWDWQMHGLCRGVDSSVFFHPDGERGRARAQREMRAKHLCRSCPVIVQCRAHALQVQILVGDIKTPQQAAAASKCARFGHGPFFAPPRKVRRDAGLAAAAAPTRRASVA